MAEPPLASQGLEAISARHNGPASAFAPIKQGAPWPRQSRASLGLRLLLVAIAELALAGLQWSMQGLGRGLPDRSKRASLLASDPQGCPWGSPASAHGLRYWLLLSRCRRMVHPWTCPDGTTQASALGSREKPGGPSSGPRWVGRWPKQPIGLGSMRTPWPGRDGPSPSGLPLWAESQVPPAGAGLLAWSQAWLWLRPATLASRFRSPSPAASWSMGNHWAVVAGPSPAEP